MSSIQLLKAYHITSYNNKLYIPSYLTMQFLFLIDEA